jgi:hypothetical protein
MAGPFTSIRQLPRGRPHRKTIIRGDRVTEHFVPPPPDRRVTVSARGLVAELIPGCSPERDAGPLVGSSTWAMRREILALLCGVLSRYEHSLAVPGQV